MKPRILIVDDDRINCKIVEKNLSRGDYDLHIVNSGEETLQVVHEFKPDLILLDVNMRGITGYETCKKLREWPQFKKTVVIFLTANNLKADLMKGYDAGGNDYLGKPFDGDELNAKVKAFLNLVLEQTI